VHKLAGRDEASGGSSSSKKSVNNSTIFCVYATRGGDEKAHTGERADSLFMWSDEIILYFMYI
jgi:hypothetical protein